jgi:hypothetical protein
MVPNNTSAKLILNKGALQMSVLCPLLYSMLTHDCVATHDSNTIITFAMTVVSLITDGNETAYRRLSSVMPGQQPLPQHQ